MLKLKRIVYEYEFMKCDISGELIGYGDFYYQDDKDGLIVKADVYHKIRQKARDEQFDYSKLNKARSESEYRDMLKKAEQQLKENTLLNREVERGVYS